MTTTVAVCGSTGSIGRQTLDVLAQAEPGEYRVSALTASSSVEIVARQAAQVHPDVVVMADPAAAAALRSLVPAGTEVAVGEEALGAAAAAADIVINGVVGFAGLDVTLAALRHGRRLGLANKESLIAAGPVVRAEMAPGAEIVPVDSEHSAIHQCLAGSRGPDDVARLILTASGGPFRGRTSAELAAVTVDEALTHPTWSMGPKITVDSSTLMNKGLEVIEAKELFGLTVDQIDVVVHPQSIVHSMVEYTDGSTIAQLSLPDMRLPIAYALAYPARFSAPHGRIDWSELSRLDFEPPDRATFGCLDLAYEAGRVGGTAPAWLNASNEVVVEAFLAGRLRWSDIAGCLTDALDQHDGTPATSVEVVIDADRRARRVATEIVSRRVRGGVGP